MDIASIARRTAPFVAALLLCGPTWAQGSGRITLVVASGPQQQIRYLDSATLAVEIRQRLDRGAMSGIALPLTLDGERHERRIEEGGNPAVFANRGGSRTFVQGIRRNVTISYGPARSGGIGIHAEVADSTLTPRVDGTVDRTPGRRSTITGVLPSDGRPQAIIAETEVVPGSTVLPDTLIVLVEP